MFGWSSQKKNNKKPLILCLAASRSYPAVLRYLTCECSCHRLTVGSAFYQRNESLWPHSLSFALMQRHCPAFFLFEWLHGMPFSIPLFFTFWCDFILNVVPSRKLLKSFLNHVIFLFAQPYKGRPIISHIRNKRIFYQKVCGPCSNLSGPR